jgi:Flp pilus assembly protein TadG
MPVVEVRARRRERGMVAVIVAMFMLVLLGVAGLAIDTSHVHAAAQQLQDAADAAALAAAGRLAGESGGSSFTQTRAAAVSVAGLHRAAGTPVGLDANDGNAPNGDVVVGRWSAATAQFSPTTTLPNAVKVTARRTEGSRDGALGTIVGSAFGVATADVARTAIATFTPSSTPFVHVLDPSAAGALTLTGNAQLGASGGKVQVNSSSGSGIKLTGNAAILADQACVVGDASLSGNASIPSLRRNAPLIADKLSGLMPSDSDWTALKNALPQPAGANGKISGSGIFSPGVYPKGLGLSSGSTATLLAGTYVFGTDFSMSGQSRLLGTGVTLLLDSGVRGSISGGASLALTPPLAGTRKGLLLMTHRATGGNALTLSGNGLLSCEGTIYVPGGTLKLSGNGSTQGFGALVCLKLTQTGNAGVSGLRIVTADGASTALVQ